ncbi:23S rRNA (guanosine(2251)-2'-O)-methyltransferase RlmB [Veillonellaceae bacterium WCA-693-APC-5D-A]|uniref:23S rRNA (Guanosine(2251)-2'-O)-methyltransferase RlmB n=2 Tax=Anaerovibrio slackiae TaxID=2652309 RepID=A0A6I2UKI6_9FIRM|nr:23S rRNA (guanosine(2251)-2'-O)-methyltransferase RlmB [Anaerovibrio slackiae]MSU10070.1 23S rRNA (guanosine(2251)-2'-O)-methyltransferase RlmB [Anaerovibrio slackiae]
MKDTRFEKKNDAVRGGRGRGNVKGEQRPVKRLARDKKPVDAPELSEDLVAGRNAVMEVLKGSRSVNRLLVANGSSEGSMREIIALAKEKGINIQFYDRSKLDAMAPGIRHQGVLAQVPPVQYAELEDILQIARDRNEPPFIVLLDELEDPHNLGAILRTADAAGVHGVLIPKHRSCPLSATVAKTSAGAVEHVPVARIGNMVQTIKKLKKEGLWVAAADMDGTDYYDTDLTGSLLLVIGSEGQGVGRLIKEQCDFVVRIPMVGKINSLNASVAGSILMYEAMKQRISNK